MTAVAASLGANQLGNPIALTDGFSAAFLGAAVVALLGAIAAAILFSATRCTPATEEPAVDNVA